MRWARVQHIHADGRVENHREAMERLLAQLGLPDLDLFRSHEDVVEDAYRMQEARIAYTLDDAASGDLAQAKMAVR